MSWIESEVYAPPTYRLIDFYCRWDRQRRLEPANPDNQGQTRFIVLDENGKRVLPVDGIRFTTLGYARAHALRTHTRGNSL